MVPDGASIDTMQAATDIVEDLGRVAALRGWERPVQSSPCMENGEGSLACVIADQAGTGSARSSSTFCDPEPDCGSRFTVFYAFNPVSGAYASTRRVQRMSSKQRVLKILGFLINRILRLLSTVVRGCNRPIAAYLRRLHRHRRGCRGQAQADRDVGRAAGRDACNGSSPGGRCRKGAVGRTRSAWLERIPRRSAGVFAWRRCMADRPSENPTRGWKWSSTPHLRVANVQDGHLDLTAHNLEVPPGLAEGVHVTAW